MTLIERLHAALFDELERQGVVAVDVGRLTCAAASAAGLVDTAPALGVPYQRCANGACE